MPPQLSEIADKAGVSEATVSRVLQAKPGVSVVTRQAVLSAVDGRSEFGGRLLFEPELVVRRSTGPAPTDAPG